MLLGGRDQGYGAKSHNTQDSPPTAKTSLTPNVTNAEAESSSSNQIKNGIDNGVGSSGGPRELTPMTSMSEQGRNDGQGSRGDT